MGLSGAATDLLDARRGRLFHFAAPVGSPFAAGIALGAPERTIVGFSGDGAFYTNAGMLLVERQLGLPNPHISSWARAFMNRPAICRPSALLHYVGMAKAAGIKRLAEFFTGLGRGLDLMVRRPGRALAVLQVAPLGAKSRPLDRLEAKFRFGRYLEWTGGARSSMCRSWLRLPETEPTLLG